jgi:hypothetical protein
MKIISPVYSLAALLINTNIPCGVAAQRLAAKGLIFVGICMIWLGLSAFVLSPSRVPEGQILSGGPPKDGIPALTYPKTETATAADRWLKPDDTVLGIVLDGQARAYPVRILNWHEIVNDRINKHRFVINYCPLCGSGMAYDSNDLFGVSGLLYQSDVLLYDHKTESLWSQLMMQAVTGPRMGERMEVLPIEHTQWTTWKAQHPDTSVLSRQTGFSRNYGRNPYAGYETTEATYFPVNHKDSRLHAKTWVIGLSLGNQHKAWTLDSLKKSGSHTETWKGHELSFDVNGESIRILDMQAGKRLPVTRLYWFAWSTFHPETELSK